jgi:ankyrin repeat protein
MWGDFAVVVRISRARKIVELLLSNSADVNTQGGYYESAFQVASTTSGERIVELLLSNGADQ